MHDGIQTNKTQIAINLHRMNNTKISDIEALKLLRELESSKKELSVLEEMIDEAVESYNTETSWNGPHCVDSSSVTYSIDRKRLLDIPTNKIIYSVKRGTELIWGFKQKKYDNNNKTLETLILPDSVKVIMNNAFSECKYLKDVSFGNGLRIIGDYAFSECGFTTLLLPESIYSIGDCAFAGNEELQTIYIPSTIVNLGVDIFDECSKLKIIYTPKNHIERIKKQLPQYKSKLWPVNYNDWDVEIVSRKNISSEGSEMVKYYHNEDTSDRDIWDAMTDGMYGNYPEEGYDGDYESLGF